jgi:hypothetical protein
MHMASISWTSGASGDWTTAADWTPATVPGATDDVTIDALAPVVGSYTVAIGATETETVNSLTVIDGAAQIEIDGTLTFAGGSAVSLVAPAQSTIGLAVVLSSTPARWMD